MSLAFLNSNTISGCVQTGCYKSVGSFNMQHMYHTLIFHSKGLGNHLYVFLVVTTCLFTKNH